MGCATPRPQSSSTRWERICGKSRNCSATRISAVPMSAMRGYTREVAIRPNSVTPQRTRNDRIAASDKAKQSVDDPDHDKLTDLVLEIAAERLSLEADAVPLGQKCPLFCRNEPVTPVGPVNSMRKLPTATKKGKLMAKSRAAYWVLSSLVLPLSGRRVGEKGEIAVASAGTLLSNWSG